MTDRESVDRRVRAWMEGYLRAWKSNEPDDIGALFTDDANYRTEPWLEPVSGADAITARWLERRDDPDAFAFRWEVSGIDGARAFVQAETRYDSGTVYSNLWVIDLTDDGRARSFTEWWMDQSDES